jgi:hypothetical protein
MEPDDMGSGQVAGDDAASADLVRRTATLHRVEYDISRTLAKTRKAGLLPHFSFLPMPILNSLTYSVRVLGLYDCLKQRMG